jgi:D-alanine-D-alanine ligase
MTTLAAPVDLATCTVAVLSGGQSGEREVSLTSARGIVDALAEDVPPRAVREVEIAADGRWNVNGDWVAAGTALQRLGDVDVFFLGLHGGPGEDGTIQGLLESAGRPYTGSGVRSSALCMDKQALRLLAADAGLCVAPAVCVSRRRWSDERIAVEAGFDALGGARWVVKPRGGGSSVDTFVVGERSALVDAVEGAFADDTHVLVEAFVEGVEVSCGVLGNADEPLQALPTVEIRPAEGRFFDYQQKYDSSGSGAVELCPAESLDAEREQRVRELAARAHEVGGCDGYSRVDFIVPPAGEPVLLEVNTLPGMTPRSLLPQEAAAVGIEYRALCLYILDRALRRGAGR